MPLVLAEHVGHFSAVLLLGTLLVVRGLEGKTVSLVVGAIVLSTKPHLFVVFALVLAVQLIRTQRWRSLLPAAISLGVLAVVSFVRYPLPLDQFLSVGTHKLSLSYQTTAQFIQYLGASDSLALIVTVLVAATAAIALGLASSIPGWHPAGEWPLVAGALVVSLIAVPYLQVWDEALLLPALFLSVAVTADAPPVARIGVLFGVVGVGIGAWAAYFAGPILGTQTLLALVPIAAAAVLFVALVIAARHKAPEVAPVLMRLPDPPSSAVGT
jgi:hypothetical protein